MKQFTKKRLSSQKSKKNPKLKKMAERIRTLIYQIGEVGAAYEEMDNLMEYAIENRVDLTSYGISVKDKFEGKNKFKAWKSTPFTRYEFVEMPSWFASKDANAGKAQAAVKTGSAKQQSFNFPVRSTR